jgi:tetratricopeptide (TPR) repeat protein
MSVERRIDGRFDIVRLAGEGGMGRVYEAVDRRTGSVVAVKVLHDESALLSGRFAREARLLAGLRHPGVVRYLSHGVTAEGKPWLAMEWLAGETLAVRLAREGVSIPESVALGLAVARALCAVHRAGAVHRDLKPSNVFLVGGAPAQPVLIDFGVARADAGPRITSTGVMIGTPGYMSPEQVRGERRIDARADVFALGCVLFECLTGRAAFAAMFTVVLEEAPRAASLRPGLPPALDAIVARMLAKERSARPSDADAVVTALEALELRAPGRPWSVPPPAPLGIELTGDERLLTCLLMARDAGHPDERALVAAVDHHHGRIERLADGALVVVLGSAGAPTDLAARAARCAFAVRDALGGAPVSLVAGLVEGEARLPPGDVIDRALRLLAAAGERGSSSPIHLDEVTAGLLGDRFDVRRDGASLALHGEREELDAGRRLLGRPTICLGRERELSLLEALFVHCAEDSEANAVLITGEAGVGKSRLRHELLRRLRERGQRFAAWVGCGDPMSAGSAFAVLARAVRHSAGIFDGDPVEVRRAKIHRRAAPLARAELAAAFLGELVGAPFSDDSVLGAQLRAARADPVLMGDQLRRAAEELLRAACVEGPVILVLEDLQWGDLPTVTFVDAALRNLADLPLLVLATARPVVEELFPRMWADRSTQLVRLPPLPRRAAERLVQMALGDAPLFAGGGEPGASGLVGAIVERAGGNAFYLEELTRAVVSGDGAPADGRPRPHRDARAELPETVLAMAQARLEGLDPELRRVLRAASIFGRTFSPGGVEALLGGAAAGDRLGDLVAGELLVRRVEAAPQGELEYGFRHALVREAAYGMLTAEDRALGHQLAGAWLEREGKGDARALAEHFERGGEPARAVTWYCRAAEEALAGNDLAAAIARAEQGAACGAGGEELGALRLVEAEALLWRGELVRAEECADAAAALLARGSSAWFRALTHGALAAEKLGTVAGVTSRAEAALAAIPAAGARSAQVRCLIASASGLALAGRYDASDALLTRLDAAVVDPSTIDPQALGELHQARAIRAAGSGDLGAVLGALEAALAAFEQAGDRRSGCVAQSNLGYVFVELGGFAHAESALRAALVEAERLGLDDATATILQNLGYALLHGGRLDEARALEERAVATSQRQGHARMEGCSRAYLARIHLAAADPAAAEREAHLATDLLLTAPPLRPLAVAVLARALSRLGRAVEALAAAEEAFALLATAGGSLEEGEALVRLVHVEALFAAGRLAEARAALAVARERVLARAACIRDPAWRERFLNQVPDNAATLAERAGAGETPA